MPNNKRDCHFHSLQDTFFTIPLARETTQADNSIEFEDWKIMNLQNEPKASGSDTNYTKIDKLET